MRRYGYIVEQIADWGNLNNSFDYEVRGRVKRSLQGRWLTEHRDEVLRRMQSEILGGTWEPGPLFHKEIQERGKHRKIDFVSIEKGIALHAIMVVVEKYIDRTFIADTGASIKGRGGLYLLRRILDRRRKFPSDTCLVFKSDIAKCYENINQDMVMDDLRRMFKDARLLAIMERCVRSLGSGMSIGLRSSQALVNLFLSIRLDHIVKDRERMAHYARYCDDTVAMFGDTRQVTRYARLYHRAVREAGLQAKEIEQMFHISDRPLDFLGYVVGGDGRIRIRKSTKQRFARRWKRVRSRRRKRELIGSFFGISKHAHTRHLFKTITGRDMVNFSELGFDYRRADGKKEFDVPKWRLSELVGHNITVKDYEAGLTTAQGDGRYLVLFEDNGRDGKFWTNKDKMKQALDFARSKGAIPFTTVIKTDGQFGYIFT